MPDPLRRRERLRHIRTLDPRRDHYEIYRLCAGAEFSWDFEQALSLALFRTFCVPSISGLLAATGEFERRAQKRYDDTKTLMAEVVEHGYDSPRGRTALRMVNRMHGRYPISNEDMLYVLSTFVYEPVRWIARYGWRPMSRHEELAGFHFYREVGRRMGIRDVPDDYRRFEEFNLAYEREHFRFAPSNAAVGRSTVDLFASWYPRPLRGPARRVVLAALDEPVRTAFGFPAQRRWLVAAVDGALRLRGRLVRLLPPRRAARFTRGVTNRTYPGYPDGYALSDLGTGPPPAGDDHP